MIDYRTGGTPWTVIIDRDGVVRYNDFHIGVEEAAALIQRLRDEPAQEGPTPAGDARENRGVQTLPASRGGQDLVGTQFPTLDFDRWVRSEHGSEQKAEDRVTLYRWWTDGCPFCEASAPAIESLREEYEPKGLRVVAVYHPKPPREVVDEAVLGAAERLGIGGEIAVDQDWSALRELWLSTGRRSATSATFIVDEDGVIRFVHPGPQFFPSDDPALTQQDADYRSIKDAVEILLQRQGQPPPD
jgi:thiol-disulfide isomerase/thioredoxin